jgi:hypothetical protein
MVKICRNCLNMFEGHIAIDNCPMRECGGWELIEIDDMLADVIIKFWSKGISTAFSCSGHLYEPCFSPYLIFGPYDEDRAEALKFFRGILIEWNDKYQAYISEIKPLWDRSVFTVRANQCEDDPKQRIKVQSDFINYLYDIVEFIPSDIFEKHVCASAEI